MENQPEQKKPISEEREEAMMLYALYLEDIRYSKTQQWQVVVFYFALQGAIIGLMKDLYLCYRISASLLVLAFVVTGLLRYESDIYKYRKRKKELKKYFTETIKDILEKKFSCWMSIKGHLPVALFLLVVAITQIFVCMILCLGKAGN